MPGPSNAATADFWRTQNDLTTLARRDLLAFWRSLDLQDPDGVVRALEGFMPDLVQTYGDMGATLAADFYDELREESPAVSRAYSARLGDAAKIDQVRASTRWAMGPLFGRSDNPGPAQAITNLAGSTKRLVLVSSRSTVRVNVAEDPDAIGWRRVGDGDSCPFCRMLIGRGEVYSAETARFGAHDRCGCQAEPAWGSGTPATVHQFIATKRSLSDADRARVKDFLANMDG